jgi:hypothetical protein
MAIVDAMSVATGANTATTTTADAEPGSNADRRDGQAATAVAHDKASDKDAKYVYSDVFARDGGKWRAGFSEIAPIPPPAPPPATK